MKKLSKAQKNKLSKLLRKFRKLSKKGKKSFGRSRRFSRRFGYGPGYVGQTSFQNAVAAPYFGSPENFINPSSWWLPIANNQYQSPEMLQNWKN